jgi:hypothetical protein
MGLLLLLGAARIIFPIIYAEGPVAVFAPWLLPRRRVAASPAVLSRAAAASPPRVR